MTLLPTVEAFPLELLLLRDSPFWSQLTIFPFVVGFLELKTLTMFHKVGLGLPWIVCPFLLKSSIAVTPCPERVYGMCNRMCTKGFLNYFSVIIEFLEVVLRVKL